jgi:ERCC4-type nuclease
VIIVDYRNGPEYAKKSGATDLLTPLLKAGLPAEEDTLEFGDLCFKGRGEGGAPLLIGLEFKKLPEFVQSLNNDRLLAQFFGTAERPGGMLEAYDRHYLLLEGEWDVDDAGRVVTPRFIKGHRGPRTLPLQGAPPAAVLEQRILTLETRGGIRVRWARNSKETFRYVSNLFRFWTDRDLDQHRSHLAIYAPDLDRGLQVPISLKRQIASQLPGIGYTKSRAVDAYFSSIWSMVNASEKEWMQVEGIGKTLAKRLVAACRGKDN